MASIKGLPVENDCGICHYTCLRVPCIVCWNQLLSVLILYIFGNVLLQDYLYSSSPKSICIFLLVSTVITFLLLVVYICNVFFV